MAETLTIKLKSQTEEELSFKVKYETPFRKIFNAYATRLHLDEGALRFVVDGHRVKDTETPADFDLEDGDVVDVMMEQVGGGSQ